MISFKEFMEKAHLLERQCTNISNQQFDDLEKYADRLLQKFDVDVSFTSHFKDRMKDVRNDPCIVVHELQKFFKKIQKQKAKQIKDLAKDSDLDIQAVLVDLERDLNIPIVVSHDKDTDEFDVKMKTIMRKKYFSSSNQKINYESKYANYC